MLEQDNIGAPAKSDPFPVSQKETAQRELDAREARFVDEYLIDLDVERAAMAAGYSETVAKTKAYQWVSNCQEGRNRKPHLIATIRARQLKLSNRLEITQERVLLELARI